MSESVKLEKLKLGENYNSVKVDNDEPFQHVEIVAVGASDVKIDNNDTRKHLIDIDFSEENTLIDKAAAGEGSASGNISNLVALEGGFSASKQNTSKKFKTTCTATFKKVKTVDSLNYQNLKSKINPNFLTAVERGNLAELYDSFGDHVIGRVEKGQYCKIVFEIEADSAQAIIDFKSNFSAQYQNAAQLKGAVRGSSKQLKSVQLYNYHEEKIGASEEMEEFSNLFKKYEFDQREHSSSNSQHVADDKLEVKPEVLKPQSIPEEVAIIEHIPINLVDFANNVGLTEEQKKPLIALNRSIDKINLFFKKIAELKAKVQEEYTNTRFPKRQSELKELFKELHELEQDSVFKNAMQVEDNEVVNQRCAQLDRIQKELSVTYPVEVYKKSQLPIGIMNFKTLKLPKTSTHLVLTIKDAEGNPVKDLEISLLTRYKHIVLSTMSKAKEQNGVYQFEIKDYYKEKQHQFCFEIKKGKIPKGATIELFAKNDLIAKIKGSSQTIPPRVNELATSFKQSSHFSLFSTPRIIVPNSDNNSTREMKVVKK